MPRLGWDYKRERARWVYKNALFVFSSMEINLAKIKLPE